MVPLLFIDCHRVKSIMASGMDDQHEFPVSSTRQSEKEFLTKVFNLILEEGVTKPLNGTCKGVSYLCFMVFANSLLEFSLQKSSINTLLT